MKKILLTLLLTVFCISISADEPPKYLVVWAKDGAKTTYALKDSPQVTFTEDALVVTKDRQETSFPMGDIQRFTYESIMLGDVNGDAKVDIVDVAKTINYLLTFTRSDFPEQAADINKDGTVDSDDVTAMIELVVNGLEADKPAFGQQAIGEAFYIYRNDGGFNAFFRDEVEEMEFSNSDADGNVYDEVVSQLVYTADSVYNIPLTAIDSVGFVTPETIYKEDAVQLTGSLFDYLISVDSLTLTFDASIPPALTPQIGDKLVTTELSEKLPLGFSGTVRLVQTVSTGIEVQCDRLELEDAVERFYGVAELVTYSDGGHSRRYLPRRAVVDEHSILSVNVNLPQIHFPLDLTGVIEPKKVYGIDGSARADITIDPVLTGRVTYVVDSRLGFSHYNIHAVLDAETEANVEIAGGVSKGDFFKLLFDQDVPMPWGYPLYIALGPQFGLSGELALGTTIYINFRHTSDITYYPTATAIAPGLSRLFNTESHSTEMTRFAIDWAYIAARAEAKLYVKGRLGLPFGRHEVGWVGAEFEIGAKCDAELQFDFEALSNAERGTGLYETLKDTKIEVMPYWGAVGKMGVKNDRFEFKFLGRDDYSFWGKKWEWYFLPQFSDTEATVELGNSIEASANITNDCVIPYTVGFSLFDENGDRVGEPQWNKQKFWTLNSFTQPLKTTFTDLAPDKGYKVYPTLRLFGFNVLASPSAEIDPADMTISTLEASDVTASSACLTGEISAYGQGISGNVAFYYGEDETPYLNGSKVIFGSVSEMDSPWFGVEITRLKPNTTYYYVAVYDDGTLPTYGRVMSFTTKGASCVVTGEEATDITATSATVYGYYEGSDVNYDFGIIYGTSYNLSYSNGTVVRANSTSDGEYAIELTGLDENTTYYYRAYFKGSELLYGEVRDFVTLSQEEPQEESHLCPDENHPHWIDLGLPSGTKWRCCNEGASTPEAYGGYYAYGEVSSAPSSEQIDELLSNTTSVWTTQNGVNGRKFTGSNGGSIFLPAAGYYFKDRFFDRGSFGYYWSSLTDVYDPYVLKFGSGSAYCYFWHLNNQSVRPVR